MRIENYQQFSFGKKLLIGILIFFLAVFCFFVFKIGAVITVVHVPKEDSVLLSESTENFGAILPLSETKESPPPPPPPAPSKKSFLKKITDLFSGSKSEKNFKFKKDPSRMDILILGIRGEDDPHGGLLADMIMVVSFKKDTGQLALISIPRDLFVYIPGLGRQERLNYAYAFGESREFGGGLKLSKKIVTQVIGLPVDYAVSIDFKAFQEIVDILGGVTIYRDKPFVEDLQWQGEGREGSPFWYKKTIRDEKTKKEKEIWVLQVPAGQVTLDGNAALYYVRSRYTTSDFDRSRRQQQILLALKDRALSLEVLANPFKILKIADSLKKHLRTDVPPEKMLSLLAIAKNYNITDVKKKILDTSPEGLLYSVYSSDGSFYLLPRGNNFTRIWEVCRNIFENR